MGSSVFVNAVAYGDKALQAHSAQIEQHLAKTSGGRLRSFQLAGFAIGPCVGCFDCWVRSPGLCRIPDEAQEIIHAVANADQVVWASEVSFGGFSAELKRVVDRHIPLLLPFFRQHEGLTHHQPRYARLPPVTVFGFDRRPGALREKLFRDHVESVTLNLTSVGQSAHYMPADGTLTDDVIARTLQGGRVPANPAGSPQQTRADYRRICAAECGAGAPPRHAVILHGSQREQRLSTSRSIADAYAEALTQAGCPRVEIIHVSAFARPGMAPLEAAQVLAAADLMIVASPLYTDTLPHLVMKALEMVRDRRVSGTAHPARLAAVINCGFPEAEHTRYAIALLREFAREAGYGFAGAWGVGEAEALAGRPIKEAGGMVRHLRAALADAAAALTAGLPIPDPVIAEGSLPFIPHAALRAIGTIQFHVQGYRYGNGLFGLRKTPHRSISREEWEEMALKGWARSRPLRVLAKHPEADDAMTLLLEDPAHDPLRWQAGQYITLEAEIGGQAVRRSYSLSSTPDETVLSITVKRVPGGVMSNHLHDAVQPGDLIRSFGPSGDLVVADADGPRTVLLVGGGSGIVPLAAIARDLLRRQPDTTVRLIHGAQSPDRAIFGPELAALAQAYPDRLSYSFVPVIDADQTGEDHGLLTADLMARLLEGTDPAMISDALLCGPDAMRAAVRMALAGLGIAAERIKEESFLSPRAAAVSDVPQPLTVHETDGTSRTLSVPPDRTALDALLDAGVPMSFSCLNGNCGSCTCRVEAGLENVVLDAPNTVTGAARAAGTLPSCIMRLRGPVTLRPV